MPAVTRSRNQQTQGKDIRNESTTPSHNAKPYSRVAPIHKGRNKAVAKGSASKQEAKHKETVEDEYHSGSRSKTIKINRAPVLELWSACVTAFLHPDLSWPACLSVGSAISTLCAISKSRSIGLREQPDEERSEQRQGQSTSTDDQLKVMIFDIKLEKDVALVGSKPKKANESAPIKKFGEEQYEMAKSTFEKSLVSWQEDQTTLESKAFHMYEKFRPTVPKGQHGWGRQGLMDLDRVREIVTKPGKS